MGELELFGGHAQVFFTHKYNFLAFLVVLAITMVAAVIISYSWGVFMLLGFVLIILGGTIIVLNRGKHVDYTFIITIGLGIFFIFLHTAGVEPIQITLDFVPYGLEIHNFFHP